jgi:hypothetical protein
MQGCAEVNGIQAAPCDRLGGPSQDPDALIQVDQVSLPAGQLKDRHLMPVNQAVGQVP